MDKTTALRWAIFTLCSLLAAAGDVFADTVTIAWDRNPEPEVVGYYVFIGTSPGDRSQAVDVGNVNTYTFTPQSTTTTYYLTVAAYAAGPLLGPAASEVVAHVNVAPMVSAPANARGTVGTPTAFPITATDQNGDHITLTAAGLPPGLTLDTAGRVISGTPTLAGTFQSSITATDPSGDLSAVTFRWTIDAVDVTAPTLVVTGPTTGASYATTTPFVTLTGTASDDTGVSRVTWATDVNGNGTAAGTTSWSVIVPLTSGPNVVTITATDPAGHESSRQLAISYQPPAPVTTSPSTTGSTTPSTTPPPSPTTTTATKPAKVPSLDIKSVTANRAAPGVVGTSVTFTAVGKGGIAPYEFQWLVYDGRRWTVLRPWASSPTFDWKPPAVNKAYRVRAWARSLGNTKDAPESDAVRTMDYPVTK